MFERGNKLAPGGPRENSGRPPDWLKAEIQKIGDPLKVIQFFYDVSQGADLEQVVTDSGETVRVPAAVKDRIRAGEAYLDRRIGKVPLEVKTDDTASDRPSTEVLIETIRALRAELDGLRKRAGVAAGK